MVTQTEQPRGITRLMELIAKVDEVHVFKPDQRFGLANARVWVGQLASGEAASIDDIAAKAGLPASEISPTLPLAFLAPKIQEGNLLAAKSAN